MGGLRLPRWGQDARQDRQSVALHMGTLVGMQAGIRHGIESLSNP